MAAVVRSLFSTLETHFARNDVDGKREEEQHIRNIVHTNGYRAVSPTAWFHPWEQKEKKIKMGKLEGMKKCGQLSLM